ncbi:MAG TPA: hypothetical protein PLW80_08060 [Spirochaetales bacterium]|nr:hypothetical protein [Spirochaetales bacterium]
MRRQAVLPYEGPQPNAGLGTELYYGSYAQTYLERDIDPDGQAVDIAAPSSRPGASARSTFYSITSYLLHHYLAVFLVSTLTYGFTTAAMMMPALYEFDIAMGRSKTQGDE